MTRVYYRIGNSSKQYDSYLEALSISKEKKLPLVTCYEPIINRAPFNAKKVDTIKRGLRYGVEVDN